MSNKPAIPPSDTTGGDNSLRNYLVEEFVEDYQHGHITRRQALQKLTAVFGSAIVATGFLAACAPEQAATPTPQATRQPFQTPSARS